MYGAPPHHFASAGSRVKHNTALVRVRKGPVFEERRHGCTATDKRAARGPGWCGPMNGITTVPGTVGSDEQRDWIANLSIQRPWLSDVKPTTVWTKGF